MLCDNPSHRVSSYTVANSRDGGGGTAAVYTLAQSAIPCSISTASAATVELFAQQNITVTHTVGVLSALLTTAVTRGMKLVTDDRSESYLVEGIRSGRASPNGTIPALTYLQCRQIL